MKYYSELTREVYDTEKELKEAEIEVTKSKADRAEEAKEVTEAIKAANEATKKATDLLSKFVKKYGNFKMTLKDDDLDVRSFSSLFNDYFVDLFDKFYW